MAKIFEADRFVPAWLAASRHLDGRVAHDRSDRNLVLEIAYPDRLEAVDRDVFAKVDAALRRRDNGLNLRTVAATIFPFALYQRHGRPALYEAYRSIMARAKAPGTWGTYALRMMAWPKAKGKGTFNPLDETIRKLDRAAHYGHPYQAAYEVGVVAPAIDLDPDVLDAGFELPTFDASCDGRKISNMPCLSHLSFKLTNRESVDLTAIYRSHHYAARALGNLLGLSQLLSFVAAEAKLKVGTLTCHSTHAALDLDSWGGIAAGAALLNSLPATAVAQNKTG